jgi:hypothetical protein
MKIHRIHHVCIIVNDLAAALKPFLLILDWKCKAKGSAVSDKMVEPSILLGASEMVRFLGQMVANVVQADLRLVDIEQAYHALREMNKSLPSVHKRVSGLVCPN